ncbi:MAG: acylphosphatase [Crenarchaeota archaeon 13_1_40CM_3_53_5]|nr:MAG: acylphosphatase [Crenarchaeota archaeon 13_1_40CM_3_53_5]
MEARAHLLISGLVQGVLFRKRIMELARSKSINGWVRNLHDGRVEAVAEGEKDNIDALIQFCKVGPPGAKVRSVDIEWSEFKSEFRGFKILH